MIPHHGTTFSAQGALAPHAERALRQPAARRFSAAAAASVCRWRQPAAAAPAASRRALRTCAAHCARWANAPELRGIQGLLRPTSAAASPRPARRGTASPGACTPVCQWQRPGAGRPGWKPAAWHRRAARKSRNAIGRLSAGPNHSRAAASGANCRRCQPTSGAGELTTRAPSARAISCPPRQWPNTGTLCAMPSRINTSACRNIGSASLALISPPNKASALWSRRFSGKASPR
jgi:hypothetical protein